MCELNIGDTEVLATQEELLLQILEQTLLQGEALAKDDMELLNYITDCKQQLIDDFDKISIEQEDVEQNSLRPILIRIEKLENDNKSCLVHKMEELKKELKSAQRDRKGVRAYHNVDVSASSYIDERH